MDIALADAANSIDTLNPCKYAPQQQRNGYDGLLSLGNGAILVDRLPRIFCGRSADGEPLQKENVTIDFNA
jgi:hypothetical protein